MKYSQTVHDIVLRPRKKTTGRDNSITLRFVLEGSVPSKKNNQVSIVDWRMADELAAQSMAEHGHITWAVYLKIKAVTKGRIVPSSRYQKWHAKAAEVIRAQRNDMQALIASKGLIYPLSNCSLKIYRYKKDRIRRDHTNRASSLEDLLVDCHVIIDDSDEVLTPITLAGHRYFQEITEHCTVIDLTAYY